MAFSGRRNETVEGQRAWLNREQTVVLKKWRSTALMEGAFDANKT